MLEIDGCCLGRRVGSRLTRGSSSCLQRKFERATSSSGGTASRRGICCSLAALRLSCRPDRVRQDRTSNSPGRPQRGRRFQIGGNGAGTPRMSPRVTSAFLVKQTGTERRVCVCSPVRLAETRCRVPRGERGAPNGAVSRWEKSKKCTALNFFRYFSEMTWLRRGLNGGSLGLFLS